MLFQNARIILPDHIVDGQSVLVESDRIVAVGPRLEAKSGELIIDATGFYLSPGFIDLHIHVGYLAPIRTFAEELSLCARHLPANGTTRYLPTLVSALQGLLPAQFRAIREFMTAGLEGAQPAGVHLEGPYIAPGAMGGFSSEQITTPEQFSMKEILDAGWDLIRIMMVAPELPGACALISDLRRRNIVAAMGHTLGDSDVYNAARNAGATHCTHTYNNRRTFPESPAGGRAFNLDDLAVADDAVTCELICDGTHVKPVWLKTIYRTKGAAKISLITDSFLCGQRCEDGSVYQIQGGKQIVIRNGVGRDMNGGLAGSVLTQDEAIRNFMVLAGAGLVDAVRCASLNPAEVIGVEDSLGSIAPGKLADIVLLTEDLVPMFTLVNGRVAYDNRPVKEGVQTCQPRAS